MAIRSLRYNDDAILRKRCRLVDEVTDRIRELLNDMAETMYAENGAGLAACQVGILKRLVTIDMGDGLLKLVNPEIVEVYGEQACVEACLSFPGRVGQTVRPQCVTIRARNEKGEEVLYTGKGDLAKCFCHELDHLDGIVFTDHLSALKKRLLKGKLNNISAGKFKQSYRVVLPK